MTAARPPPKDVRLRGFPDRASVEDAQGWADGHARGLGAEEVLVGELAGRVLAEAPVAPGDRPAVARAALDGWAVRSADTVGASAYGPLPLRLQAASGPLGPACAALVAAGAELPAGADAVLGFDAATVEGAAVEAIAAVAEGYGVLRPGQELRAGTPLPCAGRPLGPRDAALLASLGFERLRVVTRPRISVLVAGPKEGPGARDASGLLLWALVARDGGVPAAAALEPDLRGAIRSAVRAPGPDLLLVAGRTGTGPDDDAPLALADAGELSLHGIALRPGGSVGMGVAGGVPVVLLPGEPLACLAAYELVAGRMVRRLGGRDAALPHATREAVVARKIVSTVGFVEIQQVRLTSAGVEPLGVAEVGGLAVAAKADGMVVVPAPLEGYAPGARVTVYLY